jgi:hypothetical protein
MALPASLPASLNMPSQPVYRPRWPLDTSRHQDLSSGQSLKDQQHLLWQSDEYSLDRHLLVSYHHRGIDAWLNPMTLSTVSPLRHDDRPHERTSHCDGEPPLSQYRSANGLPLPSRPSPARVQARQGMAGHADGSRTVATTRLHPSPLRGTCR